MSLFRKVALQVAADTPVVTEAATHTNWRRDPRDRRLGRSRPAVESSADFQRIFALPRRAPADLEGEEGRILAELVTRKYAIDNPNCTCRAILERPCVKRLQPAQAWALDEMEANEGLFGLLPVGSGKTLLDILAAIAVPNVKVALLFVPPKLQDQLGREYDAIAQHFRVPNLMLKGRVRGGFLRAGVPTVHVIPYSLFSRADSTTMLESYRPDLVIADEGHKLKNASTATTSRVLRYFAAHPETRLCVWSGTLVGKSLKDYAHLAACSLKMGSPVPLMPNVVEEWSLALDPIPDRAPGGVLYSLCGPDEDVYGGFRRRLLETPGVVSAKSADVAASLVISERKAPKVPEAVLAALGDLRKTAIRPDGEELVEKMQVAECARQIAMGFYYRWRFPKGQEERLIYEWLEARKQYHRELRKKLEDREEHLDSPLLCWKAAERFHEPKESDNPDLPRWDSETWPRWAAVKYRVRHYTEAVWIDEYLARDAAEWAKRNKGIVWCADIAFGRKVARLAGLPYYGGEQADPQIVENGKWVENGKRSVILSLARYGTGTDGLQHRFATQLVASPPANSEGWEQCLGRIHRTGQEADEVTCEVYRHTHEFANAIDSAVRQAKYVVGTTGTFPKLLTATVDFALDT